MTVEQWQTASIAILFIAWCWQAYLNHLNQ